MPMAVTAQNINGSRRAVSAASVEVAVVRIDLRMRGWVLLA